MVFTVRCAQQAITQRMASVEAFVEMAYQLLLRNVTMAIPTIMMDALHPVKYKRILSVNKATHLREAYVITWAKSQSTKYSSTKLQARIKLR